jgi:hypothetical protein
MVSSVRTRGVDEMFGKEPGLQLAGPDDVGDEQVVAAVAGLGEQSPASGHGAMELRISTLSSRALGSRRTKEFRDATGCLGS